MEGVLSQLAAGFADVFTPANFAALVVGLVTGLLVAVLPGLTLVMGVVLALPFTYNMDVTAAIILLTAMYVSGTYAGAWTSILFRVPGEPIDVPLLWDGYTMARKGGAAQALGWTLLAALFGGLLAATVMVLLSHPVAKIALTFSTAEYFAIIFFGLASVVSLGGASLANALISLFIGLLIATVGVDDIYGSYRFTFNVPILSDGMAYCRDRSRIRSFSAASSSDVGISFSKLPSTTMVIWPVGSYFVFVSPTKPMARPSAILPSTNTCTKSGSM